MKMYPESGPVSLRLNIAESNLTAPLRRGEVRSDLVTLNFDGPKVAHDGFKPMVREEAFDAGELAVVTYLQARASHLPWFMLPATLVGRFQHHCIAYANCRGSIMPKDLEGGSVGVRSYSQTTGMWVRGILAHEYDVDLSKIAWHAHDDPHVAQQPDPDWVERFELNGRKLADFLFDGTFDAGIVGNDFPKEGASYLIPDPHEAAKDWYSRLKIVPINHIFVVHADLMNQRPDVLVELYRMLKASKDLVSLHTEIDTLPFGREALIKPLMLVSRYAYEQGLLPSQFSPDELFDTATTEVAS